MKKYYIAKASGLCLFWFYDNPNQFVPNNQKIFAKSFDTFNEAKSVLKQIEKIDKVSAFAIMDDNNNLIHKRRLILKIYFRSILAAFYAYKDLKQK